MTNTGQRIISGILLVMMLVICLSLGPNYFLGPIFLFGILALDEIHCNFLGKERFDPFYIIGQLSFITCFIYYNVFDQTSLLFNVLNIISLGLNITLVIYFFFTKLDSNIPTPMTDKVPYLLAVTVFLSLILLAGLTSFSRWHSTVILLLILTYSTDTGAWFFWPSIWKIPTLPSY